MLSEIQKLFLGEAPSWYKSTIIGFLILNPILLVILNLSIPESSGFILGWIILLQFIFTLAMALKCYPLQPGGLLAIEAVILGLTSTETIYYEISENLKVILLLIFMVADFKLLDKSTLYCLSPILINAEAIFILLPLDCWSQYFLAGM